MLRTIGRRVSAEAQKCAAISQCRCFAEAPAAPADTAEVDWTSLNAGMFTDDAKRTLGRLRSMLGEHNKLLQEYSQRELDIDWNTWTKELGPAVVSKYQAALKEILKDETLKPEVTIDVNDWNSQFKVVLEEAKKMEEASKARVQVLEDELKQMKAEMDRMSTATVDEELAANPQIAQEIDKEISEGKFY